MRRRVPTIDEATPPCPHERLVLVESGYEREWEFTPGNPAVAIEYYPQSFSDEGDGHYVVRCKTCLTEFPDLIPEGEVDWQ